MSISLLCDVEEDEETAELRLLVEQFDLWFEDCSTGQLTPEEQKDLDDLYAYLQIQEESYWVGVSDQIYQILTDRLDKEFPMLRYQLGILIDNYEI